MIQALQSLLDPTYEQLTGMAVNSAVALVGVKATYDSYKLSTTSNEESGKTVPQVLALATTSIHCLLNIIILRAEEDSLVENLQPLAYLCECVLLGYLEYNLLKATSKEASMIFLCSIFRAMMASFLQTEIMATYTITFGAMFFINHYAEESAILQEVVASHMFAVVSVISAKMTQVKSMDNVAYVLPTLICAFRAHEMMTEPHQHLYRSWVGVSRKERTTQTVKKVSRKKIVDDDDKVETSPTKTPTKAKAKPETEFAKTVDVLNKKSTKSNQQAARADGQPTQNQTTQASDHFIREMTKRLEAQKRKASSEQKALYTAAEKKGFVVDLDKGRKGFGPKGENWCVPPSGEMNAPADGQCEQKESFQAELKRDQQRRADEAERHQSKKDQARLHEQSSTNNVSQVVPPTPLTPSTGPVQPTRNPANPDQLTPSYEWNTDGTKLKVKSTAKNIAQRRMEQKRNQLARETNTPKDPAPQLDNTVTAADNADLQISSSTQALGGVPTTIEPSLTRALGTPDQHLLQDPETAKMSDGIIHIRASVLYEQMRAMLAAPQGEIEQLQSQVACCKQIIFRLKAQIMDQKRQFGIQRTMAFMEHHSWSEEQRLAKGGNGAAAPKAPDTLDGDWTIMHYNGDIHLKLEQEDDGMICGDALDFLENVSGKYDTDSHGFCIRIDIGPHVFQLVQGEMVSDFGIVMLRNFSNGVELPTEFCIMSRRKASSGESAEQYEDAMSDSGSWYSDFDERLDDAQEETYNLLVNPSTKQPSGQPSEQQSEQQSTTTTNTPTQAISAETTPTEPIINPTEES